MKMRVLPGDERNSMEDTLYLFHSDFRLVGEQAYYKTLEEDT